MPGLPGSMKKAPQDRFETIPEREHGSSGRNRRVHFDESGPEEEVHADARPPNRRARMTHWSQQDGPLTRGFARQREIAQARPVPPPQLREDTGSPPAFLQWSREDQLSLQGSHSRRDATHVRLVSPPDVYATSEPASTAPQWLQSIQAGKPVNRTAGTRAKLLHETPAARYYPQNYSTPTAGQSVLDQTHSNMQEHHTHGQNEQGLDRFSRNRIQVLMSPEAAYQYNGPDAFQGSSEQHNVSYKDNSRRVQPSESLSKKRKRTRDDCDFDEPLNKAEPPAKQTKTKIPDDIDSFGLRPEDRLRKSSEEPHAEWSTLAFIQHLKKSKGPAGPHVAATNSDNVPSAYTKFQPIWRPKPRNTGTVVTTAKFTLPVRKSSSVKPQPNRQDNAVSNAEMSKRSLFKPEKPATSSPAAEAITPRRLGGKAARALASLNDQHSVVKTFKVYQAPKPQSPVQPSKFVLYRTSRLQPKEGMDSSSTIAPATSSELETGDMEPSSPPTSPSPDYSRNVQAIQDTGPHYASRSLQRMGSTAKAVTKTNHRPSETGFVAAYKSISEAFQRDGQNDYDVRDERDVQDEADQYTAYNEMSHRDRELNENENTENKNTFGQQSMDYGHADEAEDSLEQFEEGHPSYHRGNLGYAETVQTDSHRSTHPIEESQYKPGWLSTFWRR